MYLQTFSVLSLAIANSADRLQLTGRPKTLLNLRHKVAGLRHVWGQVPLQPAPRYDHVTILMSTALSALD